jgi:pyruvate/2-oxoglutarate dehydrogenase complex dihydrolipoamide acyltransferase (E2) component
MATSTTIQVIAPGAGESVTEGTILEWHVQEGDRIEVDATLVEISTDKVDVEVPAPAAGTVVRLHVAEGDTITVGALLAEIEPGGAGSESGDAPAESDDRVDGAADGQADGNGTAPAAGGPAGGETIDIVTPGAGESVTEARCSSGTWPRATPSPPTRPSSRSPRTRSTSSCPLRRRGPFRAPGRRGRHSHRRTGHRPNGHLGGAPRARLGSRPRQRRRCCRSRPDRPGAGRHGRPPASAPALGRRRQGLPVAAGSPPTRAWTSPRSPARGPTGASRRRTSSA